MEEIHHVCNAAGCIAEWLCKRAARRAAACRTVAWRRCQQTSHERVRGLAFAIAHCVILVNMRLAYLK